MDILCIALTAFDVKLRVAQRPKSAYTPMRNAGMFALNWGFSWFVELASQWVIGNHFFRPLGARLVTGWVQPGSAKPGPPRGAPLLTLLHPQL
jgi:hypothetical protein